MASKPNQAFEPAQAKCATSKQRKTGNNANNSFFRQVPQIPHWGLMRLKIKKGLLPWLYRHHTNTPYHVQRAKTNQLNRLQRPRKPNNSRTRQLINPSTQKTISSQTHQLKNSSTLKFINSQTHQFKNSSTHQLKNSSIQKLKKSSAHQPTNSSIKKITSSPTHQLTNSSTQKHINSSTQKLVNSKTQKIINSSTHQLKNLNCYFLFYNNTLIFAAF